MSVATIKRSLDYAMLAKDSLRLKKAKTSQSKIAASTHLSARLGKLKGLPQKIGQMLSFGEDETDTSAQLKTLQESAEPLPFEELRPIIESAWQRPMNQQIDKIEEQGRAASLGQVHRAVLKDGQEVAIKVQYPGIRQAIQADMNMLGWLSIPVGNLNRGFDLKGYRNVILDDLEQELDYTQEAANQEAFCNTYEEDSFVIVPEVLSDLSSKEVLVTSWETGDTWETVKQQWPEDTKKRLGQRLLKWFLESLFTHGLMHADLHPGNIRFIYHPKKPRIVLYDFGSVYRPSSDKRTGLLRLIQASMHQSESPLPLMIALGFSEEYLSPLTEKLPSLCRVLFEPFCVEYPYPIENWQLSSRIADILGDDRLNFRIAGPPEMIFILRAFHSIKTYLAGLNAKVSWSSPIEALINSHAVDIAQLQLPCLDTKNSFSDLAKHLKIRVVNNGRVKAEITAYANAIDRIDQLLDDNVKQKINNQNLDLNKIVSDIRARGYTPGPVFTLKDNEKEVLVWLE